MKRPVTEQDLIADPSLATIGVQLGDEYEFEDAAEPKVAKFDPFTGAPLAPATESEAAPAEESAADEAPKDLAEDVEPPAEVTDPEAESADVESQPADESEAKPEAEEQAPQSEQKPEQVAEPITYADILERGISLNKVEAANLHPGISQIAQWGDMVIQQLFKPEK
jgi:hypothetical protein